MLKHLTAVSAIAFWLLSSMTAISAPRQCVLVEHYTNTSCGPCATYNPGLHSVLNSMTRDSAIKISYHVWWPGINDPFYQWNMAEVASRVNYYGVTAAPDVYMDGILNPAMDNTTAMRSAIRSRAALTSPCSIQLWAAPAAATTVHFLIRVTADQDMSAGNYRAYSVLVSDVIAYAAPNGETSFPEPFRDVVPNANPGQSFAIGAGQTFEMEGYLNRDASWSAGNLSLVGFVQNGSNREVVQTDWVDVIATTGTVTVLSPNGGETYYGGESQNITWNSASFPQNVRVQLNRTYPLGTWETLTASTANDGSFAWTVSAPTTVAARIRVTGTTNPLVGDTSNTNFSIGERTVAVVAPNGGEYWYTQLSSDIRWNSQGAGANVKIELQRQIGGTWELITNSTPNDGVYPWIVTGPVTNFAGVKITSLDYTLVADSADFPFTIADPPNLFPNVVHDPLHDQIPGSFVVTAIVTDDFPGVDVRVFYRLVPAVGYDSVAMSATGNPNEYAATMNLAQGRWEYFLRARDSFGAETPTDDYSFEVGSAGNSVIIYDDGAAEASQWSAGNGYSWAVRFDPPQVPFVLNGASIGVSGALPEARHLPIEVRLMSAGGGGEPDAVLATETTGSVGNVVGGLPADPDNFTRALFRDEAGLAPVMNGPFFIAVSNPAVGVYEAFLHDTSSARLGRSFVYDPCVSQWFNELSPCDACRPGNRMIRATGYSLVPPTVTAIRSGADIRLRWTHTQAPHYHLWSSTSAGGPYTDFEGTTSDSTFLDVGASSQGKRFYLVQSSTEP